MIEFAKIVDTSWVLLFSLSLSLSLSFDVLSKTVWNATDCVVVLVVFGVHNMKWEVIVLCLLYLVSE